MRALSRPVLVTGFGAFLKVSDNPTARLAREVDGKVVAGSMVIGHVLPVTYASGPALAVRLARALDARLVIGLGVARGREHVQVERFGRRVCGRSPDVEGVVMDDLGEGPEVVPASLDVQRLAAALGGSPSDDAGGYVCNAWAWTVPQELDTPAAFVHVPTTGMAADRLLAAIAQMIS